MADGTGTNTTGTGVETPNIAGTAPVATGKESSLSNWAGPYVTEMLGRGQAIASQPYQSYTGPLTAGQSPLQQQAFQGVASLAVPTEQMGAFSQERAQSLMNPYIQQAVQPQIDEAVRQYNINKLANLGKMTRSGAYGGTRQALMEAEGLRGLQSTLAGITGQGYRDAYDKAFQMQQDINRYGLDALAAQAGAGKVQRDVEQEGLTADRLQFEEERDFPYKQVQYMQSLLQSLPISAQSYEYSEPNPLMSFLQTVGGVGDALGQSDSLGGGIGSLLGLVDDIVGAVGEAYNDLGIVNSTGEDAFGSGDDYVTSAGAG